MSESILGGIENNSIYIKGEGSLPTFSAPFMFHSFNFSDLGQILKVHRKQRLLVESKSDRLQKLINSESDSPLTKHGYKSGIISRSQSYISIKIREENPAFCIFQEESSAGWQLI